MLEVDFYKELFSRGGYKLQLKAILLETEEHEVRQYHIIPKKAPKNSHKHARKIACANDNTRVTRASTKQGRSLRARRSV